MTAGLGGFTADVGDPQACEDIIAAALAALAAEFDVVPDHGARAPGGRSGAGAGASRAGAGTGAGVRRTTWLDTFDWRLHKAGLTLEYVPGRGGSELRLSPLPGSGGGPDSDVTQLVTGWQAGRPHLVGNLAAGPVSARIGGIVAPRALLPVAAASTAITGYRLLNGDRKTVARLTVERPSLVGRPAPRPAAAVPAAPVPAEGGPAGGGARDGTALLPPRLLITAVRGYPGQARRAERLLAAVPGIRPAAGPLLADALRALGRRPGDYSNKVDAEITAAMPASAAAAGILLRLLDIIDANVPGVLRDTDSEFLHDLRVSVRRTRSALKLFGDALGGGTAGLTEDELAFYAAEFKWIGDLTTPTRDLDVHLLDFEETARGLAAAKPDDLEPFRVYLEQRRRREFRALARGLRSARFTGLVQGWRARLTAIQRGSSGPARGSTLRSGQFGSAPKGGPAGGSAGLLAAERTRLAFAKVARRGAAITPATPPESLHDLRKRCKELRYALEFFAPLYDPAAYAKVLGDLKRLQTCLGDFQDTEVQIGEIRALAAAMLAAGEAPAVTLLAMGEVTAGLAARGRAARADFGRLFAAFAGLEGQRRMSALLRSGTSQRSV